MSQPTNSIPYTSGTLGISAFTPPDTTVWYMLDAPGATNGQAMFDHGSASVGAQASIAWTFPQAATGFEFWGWQRSGGGLANACFDCADSSVPGVQFNYMNTLSTGSAIPSILYYNYSLAYGVHNITLTNLYDARDIHTDKFGQMSLDRFVLLVPQDPPATSASGTMSSALSMSQTSTSQTSTSQTSTGTPTPSSGSPLDMSAIIGGAIGGGVLGLVILGCLVYCWIRRKRRLERQRVSLDDSTSESPVDVAVEPYFFQQVRVGQQRGGPSYRSPESGASTRPFTRPSAASPQVSERRTKDTPVDQSQPAVERIELLSLSPTSSEEATSVPLRDTDAGFLQRDGLALLPPAYDADRGGGMD